MLGGALTERLASPGDFRDPLAVFWQAGRGLLVYWPGACSIVARVYHGPPGDNPLILLQGEQLAELAECKRGEVHQVGAPVLGVLDRDPPLPSIKIHIARAGVQQFTGPGGD